MVYKTCIKKKGVGGAGGRAGGGGRSLLRDRNWDNVLRRESWCEIKHNSAPQHTLKEHKSRNDYVLKPLRTQNWLLKSQRIKFEKLKSFGAFPYIRTEQTKRGRFISYLEPEKLPSCLWKVADYPHLTPCKPFQLLSYMLVK